MKNILYSMVMMLISISGLLSCKKDQTDLPAPVEGLTAQPGRNRAAVEFNVPPNARTGKVFYGNGDFKEFTVTEPGNTQRVIVEGLPEQEQKLRVVTINSDGIVSDPRGINVTIFGSNYESGLKPRKWSDQITHSATSLEFMFENAVADETGVWIVYSNTSGTLDSVLMASDANAIAVENIDTSKAYYYYSVYKPVATAIDDFFSASIDLKTALMLSFKKENWTIAGTSGEEAGREAIHIIDNDATTFWQSRSGDAFPYWVTIDMGGIKIIDGFYYINHPSDGSGPKNLKFEISQDNASWTTVLQTEVIESYFRQRLPLGRMASARYIKVSVVDTRIPSATHSGMVEIDAYNVQNVSADNGYLTSTPVPLVNAKAPFTGDGSNPFPPLGAFRMQKLQGWKHSDNAVVSYDNSNKEFSLFIAPVWGLGGVTNGKVYQTVDLQPGHYVLKIHSLKANGPADVYGVVATGEVLPDYGNLTTASNTLGFVNLVENQDKTVELLVIVPAATAVNIGVVYNLRSQYATTGTPWTSFNIKEWELVKVQ